jgi:hypothetical protein
MLHCPCSGEYHAALIMLVCMSLRRNCLVEPSHAGKCSFPIPSWAHTVHGSRHDWA